jgi:hypothetical protein
MKNRTEKFLLASNNFSMTVSQKVSFPTSYAEVSGGKKTRGSFSTQSPNLFKQLS